MTEAKYNTNSFAENKVLYTLRYQLCLKYITASTDLNSRGKLIIFFI